MPDYCFEDKLVIESDDTMQIFQTNTDDGVQDHIYLTTERARDMKKFLNENMTNE